MSPRNTSDGRDIEEGPKEVNGDAKRLESLALERQREAAQGFEVFEEPGETIPRSELVEGSPGHETLESEVSLDEEQEPPEDRW